MSSKKSGQSPTANPTRSGAIRFHGLDTLRSLAIISVVLYHLLAFRGEQTLPAWSLPAVRMGWMGVDLFFVLSGYLISTQFLRPCRDGLRPSLTAFYRNRLYRVLPAFTVVLALYYAWPGWRESPSLPPLWQLLTFTQNLFFNVHNHAFSHVWSLCVEEHFYLLFPLIVAAMLLRPSGKRTAALIAGLVLLGVAIRWYILVHTLQPMADTEQGFGRLYMQRIYYPTYSRLDGLLAGVVLGLIRTFRPAVWGRLTQRGHLLLVGGVVLTGVACWLFWNRFDSVAGVSAVCVVIGPVVLSTGLAFLVASALSSNGWLRFKVPGAELIATLAYTIYLTQKELIHLVDAWFPSLVTGATSGSMFCWLAVYAVVCLLASAVLYLCVERPFLKLRDRRAKRA